MKKNVLALSIAAMIGGFAGTASAAATMGTATATDFVQSEGGAGHILLVPYYTAQNGNMSVIHVVNTDTTNGKAVKVRFRGAANSDDVLDFTVFLSPGDVWTGSVQADGDGAVFYTDDTSCTYPNISGQKTAFKTDRLRDANDLAGTKEGYIEILNMADLVKGQAVDSKKDIFAATKHASNGAAPDCTSAVLDETLNLDPTTAQKAADLGFNVPSGQLTGDWYVINVAETNTFSGAATAIKAVSDVTTRANGTGQFVLFPQDDAISTAAKTPDVYTADPVLKTEKVWDAKDDVVADLPLQVAVNYDFPDLSTPYLSNNLGDPAKQASVLTRAVATNQVSNQFMGDASISAKTDWVLSMPTRRYSVGANYAVDAAKVDYRVFNPAVVIADGGTDRFFDGASTSVDANGNICVTTNDNVFFDREEQSKKNGAVVSPGKVNKISLCGEVNVLSLKGDVLGAQIAHKEVDVTYTNGWGVVSSKKPLPLMGASFMSATNPASKAGVSGNYGVTWPHRFAK